MNDRRLVPITLAGVKVGTARVAADGQTVTAVMASRVLADMLRLPTSHALALRVIAGAPACPECTAGKHQNCDGSSWDPVVDEPADCPCAEIGHVAEPGAGAHLGHGEAQRGVGDGG